ncbi:MAG TPA: DMT family transporter [Micromonosporaceae bacterium]|nr:DMT family transporter [Micromonosporaceae bacterium]
MVSTLPILLAALSAVVWGTGDFSGGKASQRAQPLAVALVSQLLGLPVLFAGVMVFGGHGPTAGDIGYGALAGMAGFGGILLLYRGLSQGVMSVFAPISAVTAALIPLVVGLAAQRTPSAAALIGAVLAIGAIALVSMSGGRTGKVTPRLIGLALATGAMFGIFFAVLGLAGSTAGVWPMVGVRIGSIGVGLIAAAATKTSLRLPRGTWRWTATAGVFDITANVLYVLATERGQLSIVAPIAALYPVSTVLLALAIDRERMRPVQLAGLGLAATALVLVAA